jgi:hypothetical protein
MSNSHFIAFMKVDYKKAFGYPNGLCGVKIVLYNYSNGGETL